MLLEYRTSAPEEVAITFVLLAIWWAPILSTGVFVKWLVLMPLRRKAVLVVTAWAMAAEIILGLLFLFTPLKNVVPFDYLEINFGFQLPIHYLYGEVAIDAILFAMLIVTSVLLVLRIRIIRKAYANDAP